MLGHRLEYLFERLVNRTCTKDEEKELMEMISLPANKEIIERIVDKYIEETGAELEIPDQVAASILNKIFEREPVVLSTKNKKTISIPWMRTAAAAVLIIACITYGLFVKNDRRLEKTVLAKNKISPILPGGNKAFLTMADGSIIILDSIGNGTFQKDGTKINKLDGLLMYQATSSSVSDAKPMYNTLTTPRGGQYQVLLPDGSKVWLNAASSLRFPTLFHGNERDVELTGEAYFEIAKNKKVPFHVMVNGMQIKVLGTHFNVNAYSDEETIKTSLLEGSVQITSGGNSNLLKPGQQAVLKRKDSNVEIVNADMDNVIAWKNGMFRFDGADVNTIMRDIGRWYDVEIHYEGKLPNRRFEGKISRNMTLNEVLEILKLSQVELTVIDKQMIVK